MIPKTLDGMITTITSSRFTRNPEVDAKEFLENNNMHKNVCNTNRFDPQLYDDNHCKKVKYKLMKLIIFIH